MDKDSRALRKRFFQERIPVYRKNPVVFAREVLLFEPDGWQRVALMDLAGNPKVAIKSGQGVGKTGLEAVAMLWFLCCHPYPRVVATAPTKQQLHDVLWSEVAKWQERSPLLKHILKWTKTYIYMIGYEKRWFATARTATKPENMQGFHEDNMLFIVDEASGVADPIMEAILGTLSGRNNKLLLCGNPTRTSGTFYDAFNADRALYMCHTVSSADSPRTSKQNIEALIRKYGRDSNVVLVRVFGKFPKQEDDVFIPLSSIEQCGSRVYELSEDGGMPYILFGVDVARFGDDETIIYRNARGKLKLVVHRRGQDLMATVGDIVVQYRRAVEEFPEYKGWIYVNIDDTGLGGGVTDRLKEVKREQGLHRLFITPINAAEKIDTDTKEGKEAAEYYNNLTTHMWAVLRDLLENRQIEIEDEADTFA
ncbi:MAG: DEAD/DEAH box helicase family protein, partial [Lachnospiraceae bacterium]|nr:DEAD/DEAH box helicase family protein [Lachnospiraceae bacterium]